MASAAAIPRREPCLSLYDLIIAPYHAFNWLTDLVFVTVYHLFGRYGAPIVFVAALAEATVGLGLIFPGVVIMFIGGAAAARGEGSVALVLAAASLGTIFGDLISYAIGRWWADLLFRTRLGPSLRVGAALMEGRARWLIPFYHFHNVTRTVGPFGAGAVKMPLRTWVPLDFFGAVLANLVWVGGGFILGFTVLTDEGKLEESPVIRIGLIAIALAWFLLMQGIFQKRMREMEATERAAVEADRTTERGA
ncbi:MAG: hypothetical protein DWI58_10105 [Chloroflexi bacterium]|nr:MAG: hypothetical protein DWI58_10105 [Chloroflexota bacterium]